MNQSRRIFLLGAATTAALGAGIYPAVGRSLQGNLGDRILAAVDELPGQKALKFLAPASPTSPEWSVSLNPDTPLFCGSSFKAYVLTEFLRQVEAGKLSLQEQLTLDDSVFSLSSSVFNPPNLTGKVTAQTVLEAMISHSDNTATDMALKRVGAAQVRQFISEIGLKNTRIPTSTRQFFGYISGDPNWQTISWDRMNQLMNAPKSPYPARPIINDTETMVGSPNDFVSFYARALQGEFFQQPATLANFRAILSLADAIAPTMPLGTSAFLKGGSIDAAPDYVMSVAGGVWVNNRWVYFSLVNNWQAANSTAAAPTIQRYIATARQIFAWIKADLVS
ncbi:MAG: class A beta-lactamase-related serine hydrolase [Aphanocapsa sp. GSE-SYN-MK-11-07L]|jgi:beta-lactamase class A|nr:class A beta-lactamase-related serine hydrolase [Aphanocapsa sp. GSE-SYN-MK-11-07L]